MQCIYCANRVSNCERPIREGSFDGMCVLEGTWLVNVEGGQKNKKKTKKKKTQNRSDYKQNGGQPLYTVELLYSTPLK